MNTMELTDEERELVEAYRRADHVTRRSIRVVAFEKWEPVPQPESGRIIATNTARSFSDLR